MGIDISGNMVVGAPVEKIKKLPCEDIYELGDWVDDNDMISTSPWFDCGPENWTIGFEIKDVPVDKMDDKWMTDIKAKAAKFEALTGTKAKLMGMASVW